MLKNTAFCVAQAVNIQYNCKTMQGLIITNAFYMTDNLNWHIERFKEEFNKLNVKLDFIRNNDITAYIRDDKIICDKKADFIIYFDKDIHILRMLEKLNYKVFNSSYSMEVCDDKMKTYIELSEKGIKMPKTINSPLMYKGNDDGDFLLRIEKEFVYPIIVKECYGSFGMQVYKADNFEQLKALRENLKYKPHIYQEFIKFKPGQDVRIIVIGGKAVAAMLRKSETDFRSNLELGGKQYSIKPEKSFIEMAESAAKFLKLDYCGVDILFGKDDEPILCEVNSNAYFNGIEKETKVNIAGLYAKHIKDKLIINKKNEY